MSTGELPKYAQIAAEVLIEVSAELERLGARLCEDYELVQAHIEPLQGIDRIVQTQRSLAAVLSANQPDHAVEELSLEYLRQKMAG
jgi:hypothetical protein